MRGKHFKALISMIASVALLLGDQSTSARAHRPERSSHAIGAQAAEVLVDLISAQTGSGPVPSQNFEPVNDLSDSEAADDFTVTVDGTSVSWSVTKVEVVGLYSGSGAWSADSATVRYYANSGSLPGTLLGSATAVPSGGLTTGSFTLDTVSPPLAVGGTYWVSVQANMPFTKTAQTGSRVWYWTGRTPQTLSASAWKNPGQATAPGCIVFAPRVAQCGVNPSEPDMKFRLTGIKNTSTLYLPLINR